MNGGNVKRGRGRPRNRRPSVRMQVRIPADMYDRIQALPGATFSERLLVAAKLGMHSPDLARELLRPGWRERDTPLVFVEEEGVVQVEGDDVGRASA